MDTDPVRSIRMAAALNQRYGDLLRTKVHNSVDNLELKIGEAQQIYPEIWRYLDEARTALVARGVAVRAYDEIRATEQGHLAVTDIEVTESFHPTGLIAGPVYSQTKTATFNHGGHRKAAEACLVLKRALPDVDWAGLDRAEQAEIAAAGSLTAGNWKQLGAQVGVLAAILLVVVIIYKMLM